MLQSGLHYYIVKPLILFIIRMSNFCVKTVLYPVDFCKLVHANQYFRCARQSPTLLTALNVQAVTTRHFVREHYDFQAEQYYSGLRSGSA